MLKHHCNSTHIESSNSASNSFNILDCVWNYQPTHNDSSTGHTTLPLNTIIIIIMAQSRFARVCANDMVSRKTCTTNTNIGKNSYTLTPSPVACSLSETFALVGFVLVSVASVVDMRRHMTTTGQSSINGCGAAWQRQAAPNNYTVLHIEQHERHKTHSSACHATFS